MKKRWLIGAVLVGSVAGGALVKKVWLAKYREQASALAVAEQERDLLYTWLLLTSRGISLAEYFSAHGIQSVAVLGMGRIGRRFIDEIQRQNNVTVQYGADAVCSGAVHETLMVYRLEDDVLPPADCMVICDLAYAIDDTIIQGKFSGCIVGLHQVLAWLLETYQIKPRDGAIEGWPSTTAQ